MAHPDFHTEPVPGLAETLPAGEVILWQGRPRLWRLAIEAMGLGWICGYFLVLALWRIAVSATDRPLAEALGTGVPPLLLGALACGLVLGLAWLQARATLYTITSARVVMRIGAALSLTLNLPFARLAAANLITRRDGSGTIALTPVTETRISRAMLWPHLRPWHFRQPQPALRCIPEAEVVARLLAEAAETRLHQPQVSVAPQRQEVPA